MLIDPRDPRSDDCISDLSFDEWRTGEVGEERVAELEHHLASCERCQKRKAALEDAARAFLDAAPAFRLPEAQVMVPLPSRRRTALWLPAATALAAAAGLALLLRNPVEPATTRAKGSAHIGFHVKRGEHDFEGVDDERVHPGERVRFVVTTTEPRHLAILSLDAAGIVSVYHPAGPETQPVGPGRGIALDSSIELDETLGPELVFALFCRDAVALDEVRAELVRSGDLTAPDGCTLDRLRIQKEPTP